jgi:UDP-N-acetylmuramoyl-L-alanyl-D-glutamate--2,6-diaminopimelate ligase
MRQFAGVTLRFIRKTSVLRIIKKLIPNIIWKKVESPYHRSLAFLGALAYRFPSRSIKIVGVTGTKGKTTTIEIINSILEFAGYKTAVCGTLRFKIGEETRANKYKMTMPGRFFMQRFLRKSVNEKCDWVILEMTSEGVRQWRHRWIDLDALVFTNISPEHIESHGTFEKYLEAKMALGHLLEESPKEKRAIIANGDDPNGVKFLELKVPYKYGFLLSQARPFSLKKDGINLTFQKKKMHSPLIGTFNLYNILAAIIFAKHAGISTEKISQGIEKIGQIRGRVEFVRLPENNPLSRHQLFDVVVDYAHTPDSLRALYEAFSKKRKICVLGNTGGGRDKWKRQEMGAIADNYCTKVILTNEDPYDENPVEIVNKMKEGITKKPYEIIMDRREAIRRAFELASPGDAVLITGKGTDPYIMGPRGTKTPWDDATVAREELEKFLTKNI